MSHLFFRLKEEKFSVFNLSPRLGYFLADNFVLGANIKTSFLHYTSEDITTLAAGPFIRYYFIDGKIVPFIDAEASFGNITDSWSYGSFNSDDKSNISMFGFGGGVAFFINEFISIDALAGYKSYVTKSTGEYSDKNTVNSFGLGVGFTVTF